ncbi:MAG: right-handed parallel beta-helix repeat-containing protein, partial [Bacteroidetes bacterium]|nr:right-handed parallel beta-helix repeat-containing protein [Bacteroidota bacterium]
MKRLTKFIAFFFLLSAMAFGQTDFLIGAEWLNNPARPGGVPHVPSAQDYLNITDLGLNWGMAAYRIGDDISYANATLTGAESNNIKLMLDRYQFYNAATGQRWQYHPEYDHHYPIAGRTGEPFLDNVARAYKFPDNESGTVNTWQTIAGTNSAGYIATGLIPNTEQEDNNTYYIKLRIRLTTGTPFNHTPVCSVIVFRLSDGYEQSATIYADQFSNYSYTEITAFSFYKTSSGPFLATNEEPGQKDQQEIYFPNNSAHTGIPQPSALRVSGAAFDYRVYWPGNVTCYLDYVIIDDVGGNNTLSGNYDTEINDEVDRFKSRSGLGRFKVRDEVTPAYYGQYLCIGYVDNKIKANVIPSGYPTKTGSHYNVGYWLGPEYIGRDIAWTLNNQSLVNIYPISQNDPSKTDTPLPDNPAYTQIYQSQIQSRLVDYLRSNITYANNYAVPFWFAPQAHSWSGSLREPTTMELKQMVNLGLAYGAKGIQYFLYWSISADGCNGLVNTDGTPRRTIYAGTSYSGDKWTTVKAINQKLAGPLGATLVNLTWQNAFSIHQDQPTGTYVTSVTTSDAANERYVELGLFKDGLNNDYFMLVNRRTRSGESRNITMAFNNSTSWEISDLASGNTWVIPNNGGFTDNLNPGEGKLYKISLATYTTTRTIPTGKTMTVTAGSILTFQNGASLIVNGTLNAAGNATSKITFDFQQIDWTTQNGIKILPGGVVNISNAIIKNAKYGVYNFEGITNISNSEILNCFYGIYLYRNNYVGQQSQINNNIIHGNHPSIHMHTSSPDIRNNTIYDNLYGVYCWNNSSPYLGNYELPGFNNIYNNYYGFYAVDNCFPFLGRSSCLFYGGYNKLENNESYNLKADWYCEIYAENNWWGSDPPDANKIQAIYYSFIDYDPWLTEPPFRQLKNHISSPEEYVFDKNFPKDENQESSSRQSIETNYKETLTGYNPDWPIRWKLLYARSLIGVRKFKQAQSVCKEVILNHPDSTLSSFALDLLWQASRQYDEDSLKQFLEFLSNKSDKKKLYASAELILTGYDKQNKVQRFNKIIKKYSGERIIEFVLFSKFLYYFHELDDEVNARLVLAQLDNLFPDSKSAIEAHNLIGDNQSKAKPFGKSFGIAEKSKENKLPNKY